MDKIERAVDDIRRKWAPDSRLAVFEISLLPKGVAGVTSSRDARDALRRLAGESQLVEKVELIPDGVVAPAAIVTAALAPLMGEPRVSAPRATEALHGEVLEVLEQRAEWLRVRAPDGYIAWLNTGYIATGPTDWAEDWTERATSGCRATAISNSGKARRSRCRPMGPAMRRAICSSLRSGAECHTWRCGPARVASCMRRCRGVAWGGTICLAMSRAW